jgi:hypothetical protein
MKKRIFDFFINICCEVEYRLRRLCETTSPKKRLAGVLVIGSLLCIVFIYILTSSILNIGKEDESNKFMQIRHIQPLELQTTDNEELLFNNFNTEEYEYE